MKTRTKWLGAAVAVVVVAVVGGPYVYIHFIREDPPAVLAFSDGPTTTPDAAAAAAGTPSAAGVEGVWKATSQSVVGYRVKEVLFGQSADAAGRTSSVTGTVTLHGTTVASAEFTIDMTTVVSPESRRDRQFKGRIMNVAKFPTATFALTTPIALSSVPGDKQEITASVNGQLTLKGKTNAVTFDLKARRNGSNIEVNGQIPVVFADYGIDNPSTTGITTEDKGLLELLLVFAR